MNNRILNSYTESQREIVYLFGYFMMSLFSWVITNQASAYVSQWLGNHQFGDFSVSLRIAHNLAHLFVMGQEATLLMFLSKYQHEPEKQTGLVRWVIRSTLWKTFLVLSCIALALVFQIGIVNRIMWIGFVSIPFVVICGIYERFFLFLRHFFVSFIPRGLFHPIILMGFIYLVYTQTPSSEVALWLYALAFCIAGIASAVFGYYSGFHLTEKGDQSDVDKWRVAGIYYTISTLIIKSTPSIALLFLKKLGPDTTAVAHFAAIYNLIYGFHLLTKPFDSYLKPFIARLHADGETEALQNVINFVNGIRWFTIISLFIGLTFFGKKFLASYGDGFVEASLPLAALAFLSLIQYLGQPAHEILNYTGHQKELSIIMALQFFLIGLFSIVYIPTMGIWGAVIAHGVPCVIATIISSRYLYRKTQLKSYFLF